MSPTHNFTLDANSYIDMANYEQKLNRNVYTDGSKLDGQVGAGVYILRDNHPPITHSARIPDHSTVYQA